MARPKIFCSVFSKAVSWRPRACGPQSRLHSKRSACGRWHSILVIDTTLRFRSRTTSSAGWRTSPSRRGTIHCSTAAAAGFAGTGRFVAGTAAAAGVALLALGLAVPLLSLAWGNESAARRNEQKLRILAMEKAREAKELQKLADGSLATAHRERAAAIESETKANDEKDRAEKALEFLVAAFRKPDPALDGHSLKVVDLLDRAVRELNQSFRDQPLMEATILSAIGQTFGGLGMPEKSFPVLERAVALRSGALGEDHPETVRALHNLAMAFQDAGRFDQAIKLLEQTLARRKAVENSDPSELIESLNDLAVAYWESGQPARAVPLYEAALEKVRARLGEDHADTLLISDNLAVAYAATGRCRAGDRASQGSARQIASGAR